MEQKLRHRVAVSRNVALSILCNDRVVYPKNSSALVAATTATEALIGNIKLLATIFTYDLQHQTAFMSIGSVSQNHRSPGAHAKTQQTQIRIPNHIDWLFPRIWTTSCRPLPTIPARFAVCHQGGFCPFVCLVPDCPVFCLPWLLKNKSFLY